jgi:outer membrane protein OmpA-like peptidoglycan-associated protein
MSYNKSIAFALCLAVTGCAQTPQDSSADGGHHWWSFGSDRAATKVDNKAGAAPAVPTVDPKVTQAWLDSYEPKVRAAVKDSHFTVERRESVLVIIAPVDSSFNPKRPELLLPVSLGPITNVAKAIETDPKTAVLILGHSDSSGAAESNQAISQQRAQSVAAIFRLSGLERSRLSTRGMGGVMPRAANDSLQGRALNRRVEILLTPKDTMVALVAKYSQPTPPAAEMVVQSTPAAAAAPAKATAKKKGASSKKAATKKTVTKKKAAPAKAKAEAKKAAPAAPASGN